MEIHSSGVNGEGSSDAESEISNSDLPSFLDADPLAELKSQEKRAWEDWLESASLACGTVELGSGSGRWSEHIRESGRCRAVMYDIMNGKHQDLSKRVVQDCLMEELVQGLHWCVLASVPSGSFGRSSKPPLRSKVYPMGLPGLTEEQRDKVQAENSLLEFVLSVGERCGELGIWFFLERSGGTLHGELPQWKEFVRKTPIALGPRSILLEFCGFGGRIQRKTEIISNAGWFSSFEKGCPGCASHVSIREAGAAERNGEYPEELARSWAQEVLAQGPSPLFREKFPERDLRGPGPIFVQEGLFQRRPKIRAPALAEAWGKQERWRVVIQGSWKRREHINVLEARAALQAVRRLSRNPKSWSKKILGLTDSQVVAGCYGKGRSSAASLVSSCRRLSSLQLGLRMKVRWRWIETWRNMSDLPSRGGKVPGVK
jgi:hypothetical protein